MTTQDLVQSAPESLATIRKRQRIENAEREKLQMENLLLSRFLVTVSDHNYIANEPDYS